MQIQSISNITAYKNNYPQSINGVNYKSKNNNLPSFKEGEEILVPVMFWAAFFWGGSLVWRRVMRIFNINSNANDNNPKS